MTLESRLEERSAWWDGAMTGWLMAQPRVSNPVLDEEDTPPGQWVQCACLKLILVNDLQFHVTERCQPLMEEVRP